MRGHFAAFSWTMIGLLCLTNVSAAGEETTESKRDSKLSMQEMRAAADQFHIEVEGQEMRGATRRPEETEWYSRSNTTECLGYFFYS